MLDMTDYIDHYVSHMDQKQQRPYQLSYDTHMLNHFICY